MEPIAGSSGRRGWNRESAIVRCGTRETPVDKIRIMWVALLALLFQAADTGAGSARFLADGVKALDGKRYDAAVESFTQAVAADPKDYAARFQLALAYSLLGRNAEAVPHYKAALDLKPGLYESEINLGICLLRTRDPDGALPYLKSAVQQKATGVPTRVLPGCGPARETTMAGCRGCVQHGPCIKYRIGGGRARPGTSADAPGQAP